MYSKSVSLFDDGCAMYYKDGRCIGMKVDGEILLYSKPSSTVDISRAQAYRYWVKHFPDRPYYTLPLVLALAVNKPTRSRGVFVNKRGEYIGYEG